MIIKSNVVRICPCGTGFTVDSTDNDVLAQYEAHKDDIIIIKNIPPGTVKIKGRYAESIGKCTIGSEIELTMKLRVKYAINKKVHMKCCVTDLVLL